MHASIMTEEIRYLESRLLTRSGQPFISFRNNLELERDIACASGRHLLDDMVTIYGYWLKGYSSPEIAQVTGIADTYGIIADLHLADLPIEPRKQCLADEDALLYGALPRGVQSICVTIGMAPTGQPHLGNLYTIVNGIKRVNDICLSSGIEPRFVLGFNDLETCHRIGDVLNGYATTIKRERPLQVESIYRHIMGVVEEIYRYLGIDVEVSRVSDMQAKPEFRDFLMTIKDEISRGKYKLMMIHPECGYAVTVPGIFSTNEEGYALCPAESCNKPLYRGDFEMRKEHKYTFLLSDLMSLRDAFYHSGIHIFGGDYRTSGFKRFIHYVNQFGPEPLPYLTGMVYNRHGEAMHKSRENTIEMAAITAREGWVERLLEIGNTSSLSVGYRDYRDILGLETI